MWRCREKDCGGFLVENIQIKSSNPVWRNFTCKKCRQNYLIDTEATPEDGIMI